VRLTPRRLIGNTQADAEKSQFGDGTPIKDTGSIHKTVPNQKNLSSLSAPHSPDATANRPSAPVSSFLVILAATPLAVLFSHPSGLSPVARPEDLVVGRPFSAFAEPENYPCRPVSIT
jgi:hypothetical protein